MIRLYVVFAGGILTIMAITYADIENLMTASIAALDAGDYALARRKAIAAQGRLALVPDAERSGGSSEGSQKMTWTRQSISDYIKQLRIEGNIAVGIQVSNVEVDPLEIVDEGSTGTLGEF